MRWLKKLFGRHSEPVRSQPENPPRPSDWCKTMEDLRRELSEGRRKTIGQPEIAWARDYTRSLIPPGARFPRKGDCYEAQRDLKVTFMTAWSAPFTGDGEAMIRIGEQFKVDGDFEEQEPLGTYVTAVNYDELEKRIVDPADRSNPKYKGFYFYFETVELIRDFKLVEMNREGEMERDDGPEH